MGIKPQKIKPLAAYLIRRYLLEREPLPVTLNIADGFVIRDFPGLQYEQDTKRLQLIEKYLDKDGVILFVFNAEETDSVKEDKLLYTLFTLLQHQNGSWQSVLFILNRQDAFARDKDPKQSLDKALQDRKRRIANQIQAVWNYTPPDAAFNIIPLSAGLVFAVEQVCWPTESANATDREYFQDYVAKHTISLIPEHIKKNLPRKVNKWNYIQWIKFQKIIYYLSGLIDFAQALKQHTESYASVSRYDEFGNEIERRYFDINDHISTGKHSMIHTAIKSRLPILI